MTLKNKKQSDTISSHSQTSFQDQLNSGLRAVIREEVGVALREQGSKMTDSLASYLRSGAGTPVPGAHTPDVSTLQAQQDQIKQLVNRGKLDKAFQMVSYILVV